MPVFISRGVVQVSAYIDALLASLLPTGAVTGISNAALLLHAAGQPLRRVGRGIRTAGDGRRRDAGRRRRAAVRRTSRRGPAADRVLRGALVGGVSGAGRRDRGGAVLQTGRFTHADAVYVWAILAGSSVGLVASTLGRLYSSTFYALRDTRTPLRFALVRVSLTTVLGYLFAIPLPRLLGIDPGWGAAGLTASAGLAGWIEMLLLRHAMRARIGSTGMPATFLVTLWGAAIAGAALGWLVKLTLPPVHPIVAGGSGAGAVRRGLFRRDAGARCA